MEGYGIYTQLIIIFVILGIFAVIHTITLILLVKMLRNTGGKSDSVSHGEMNVTDYGSSKDKSGNSESGIVICRKCGNPYMAKYVICPKCGNKN